MSSDEQTKQRKFPRIVLWGGLATLLVIAIIAVVLFIVPKYDYKTTHWVESGCTNFCWLPDTVPDFGQGELSVKYNERGVRFINSSSLDWTDCTMGVNNTYFYDDEPTLKSSSAVFIPYEQFTKLKSVRLDSKYVKPEEFKLTCDIGDELYSSVYEVN